MNAASQVPSGVFTSTLVSTTSRLAPDADPAAASPAVTERATKSRRAISPDCVSFLCWFFWSSVMEYSFDEIVSLYSGLHILPARCDAIRPALLTVDRRTARRQSDCRRPATSELPNR